TPRCRRTSSGLRATSWRRRRSKCVTRTERSSTSPKSVRRRWSNRLISSQPLRIKFRRPHAVIEACLWTAPFESLPIDPRTLRDRTDVAIVGAGYTGLSAALTLARRGVSTTVLEAHRVGFGASSRNGGMALTGLKLSPDALVQRYGKTVACAFFDASLSALD